MHMSHLIILFREMEELLFLAVQFTFLQIMPPFYMPVLSGVSREAQSSTQALTRVYCSSYTSDFIQLWLYKSEQQIYNIRYSGDNTFNLV